MAETFSNIVQRTIKVIGEVPGTSVQTYSQPRVEEAMHQVFNLAFRKAWWPQYMKWFELTLDGVLGIVTTNITDIKDVQDIKRVIREREDKGIPRLPNGANPFNIQGTTVLYYEPLPFDNTNFTNRLLQFWPKAAIGNIKIQARCLPTLVDASVIYLNTDMLVNGAAWMILEDEDINPNAANLRKGMFDEFFKSIEKAESDQPIEGLSGSSNQDFITNWQAP